MRTNCDCCSSRWRSATCRRSLSSRALSWPPLRNRIFTTRMSVWLIPSPLSGRTTGTSPHAPRQTAAMTLAGAVNWTFLGLALTTTVLTGWLLLWSLIGRRGAEERTRSDRRRPAAVHGDPREALALVGDALAATHNPRVLLPVILEVISEATGALGGQVFVGGEEVAWVGEVGGGRKPLTLRLGFSGDGETTMQLFPRDDTFNRETRKLAE